MAVSIRQVKPLTAFSATKPVVVAKLAILFPVGALVFHITPPFFSLLL